MTDALLERGTLVVDICYFWRPVLIQVVLQNNRYMESVHAREVMLASEVAKLLRISKQTFSALCESGEGPPGFHIGSKQLWRRDHVFRWIEQRLATTIQDTTRSHSP